MKRRLIFPSIGVVILIAALSGLIIYSNQTPGALIQLEDIADGIPLPVGVADPGDGSNRLFVVSRDGKIMIVQDGQVLDKPFLDISQNVLSDTEQGLVGFAFDPDYPENHRVYVSYINLDGDEIFSRFTADGNTADPASETRFLFIPLTTEFHHSGTMIFGPDGNLYIGTGDGGGVKGRNNAQDLSSLLGKILRIDVRDTAKGDGIPYAIPPDNPFVDQKGARDEIWMYGLRNPWRFSFDRATGDLYIGDVGQENREEIDYHAAGDAAGVNYGWPHMEANHCFSPNPPCDIPGLVLPVITYRHFDGNQAVMGGYVYRGSKVPSLAGQYLFADYGSGRIWATSQADNWRMTELADTLHIISSIGQDAAGELYVTDISRGKVMKIVPAAWQDQLMWHLHNRR